MVFYNVENIIQYYLTLANLDSIVPHLFVKSEFSFEAAINMVGLATGFSVDCVLSIDMNDSFKEMCEWYDLEGIRRATIEVPCGDVVQYRLL